MSRGTLIVFVKAPQAGRVKTRLGRAIGYGRAAAIFRHLTALTLAEATKLAGDVDLVLAVLPPAALREWRQLWPPAFARVAQAKGDLGARLRAAIVSAPKGPVVVIGADAPGFRGRHVREAFTALGVHDAVFGPAADGGFWLIGLARRRRAPDLFEGVRWSSKHALKDAEKSLPNSFRVVRLETLADIDEADDLQTPILRSSARMQRFVAM